MKIIRKYKYLFTFIFILSIIFLSYFIKRNLNNQKYELTQIENNDNTLISNNEEKKEIPIQGNKKCNVDIKGAVVKPGVYNIDCDKNINYVIKVAGGLTKEANTTVINLAKKITDEMVIIIYTNEEIKKSNIVENVVKIVEKECHCPNIQNDGCINEKIDKEITNKEENTSNSSKLININTASIEELQTLPNIGESKSLAIIEYRKQNGKFTKPEDILKVSGIGEKLYEEIKVYITT